MLKKIDRTTFFIAVLSFPILYPTFHIIRCLFGPAELRPLIPLYTVLFLLIIGWSFFATWTLYRIERCKGTKVANTLRVLLVPTSWISYFLFLSAYMLCGVTLQCIFEAPSIAEGTWHGTLHSNCPSEVQLQSANEKLYVSFRLTQHKSLFGTTWRIRFVDGEEFSGAYNRMDGMILMRGKNNAFVQFEPKSNGQIYFYLLPSESKSSCSFEGDLFHDSK